MGLDEHLNSLRSENAQPGDPSVRASLGGIGFLSRNAMAEPPGDEPARVSRKLGLKNLVRAVIGLEGTDPAHSRKPDSSITALMMPASTHHVQMSRKGTEKFMNLFLDEIAILYPHFDRPRLKRQYQLVIAEESDAEQASSRADSYTIYMVVAIGTLLSPDSMRLDSFRTHLQDAAWRDFCSLLDDGYSPTIIECLILSTILATLTPSGGSSWHLLGLTMKQCISLGLHREPEQHLDWTPQEMDSRRRLFWSVYILDRSLPPMFHQSAELPILKCFEGL